MDVIALVASDPFQPGSQSWGVGAAEASVAVLRVCSFIAALTVTPATCPHTPALRQHVAAVQACAAHGAHGLREGLACQPHPRIAASDPQSWPCPWQVLTEASEPRIHAAALRTLLALASATAAELPPALSPTLLGNMRTWALVSMRSAADSAAGPQPSTGKDLFHIQVSAAAGPTASNAERLTW